MALWLRWMTIGTIILLIGALVGWAMATVLFPNREVLEARPFTTVEVVDGEIEASLNLSAVAEWRSKPVGVNRASGVVTAVLASPAAEVAQGSRLYEVNLRPVFVAEGIVPASRTLAQGLLGEDVAQLQRMLQATGHYTGAIDGRFGGGTASAVRAWQRSVALPVDGVVPWGDLIFVPSLPTRVTLDEELVYRDATLTGGEAVLRNLALSPDFLMPVTSAQAVMMPPAALVQMRFGEHLWEARVGTKTPSSETGAVDVALVPADGDGPICAEACGELPVTGPAQIPATVITVPMTRGLVVPSAAIASRADGSIVVVDVDGVEHAVTLLAQARGMSAVGGIRAGLIVRVPGR